MKRLMSALLVLTLVGGLGGCVATEAGNEVGVNAAASDRVLQMWDMLDDGQKKQAYWKQARAWHNLDYSLNGREIPAEFVDDPWAGTAPVNSSGR